MVSAGSVMSNGGSLLSLGGRGCQALLDQRQGSSSTAGAPCPPAYGLGPRPLRWGNMAGGTGGPQGRWLVVGGYESGGGEIGTGARVSGAQEVSA